MRSVFLGLAAIALVASVPSYATDEGESPKVTDRSDPNYVRCKRMQVTGSIAKRPRVCRTNAEWARIADIEQSEANRFVEDNRGRPPGGP